jgi:hypothetical protein
MRPLDNRSPRPFFHGPAGAKTLRRFFFVHSPLPPKKVDVFRSRPVL